MTSHAASFASDNYAPMHPEVLDAIREANSGYAPAYGDDPWTERLRLLFKELFGPAAEAFPVFNGTAANVLGLSALVRSFQGVLCAAPAHIAEDECGAPEKFIGSKLLLVPAPNCKDGKLTPESIEPFLRARHQPHQIYPGAISITQSTEFGTVYTPEELRAISGAARARGLRLHMDGARIANAAASLGVSLRALTTDVGVDALSFGGTKNGLMLGEVVVFLNPEPAWVETFPCIRKQGMQLASKMRFISAQLEALLRPDPRDREAPVLWLRSARHANAMARRLAERVRGIPGVELLWPVQANGVFARLPNAAIPRIQERYPFYVWAEGAERSAVRWMASFCTTEADVDGLAARAREVMTGATI